MLFNVTQLIMFDPLHINEFNEIDKCHQIQIILFKRCRKSEPKSVIFQLLHSCKYDRNLTYQIKISV